MGVLFFILNAVFALVILVLVLWTSVSAVVSKNPETRYQPMQDDRSSFIKSQSKLNTELDALGATARGNIARRMPIDDDDAEPRGRSATKDFDRSTSHLSPNSAGIMGFGDSYDRSSASTVAGSLRDSHSRLLPIHPERSSSGSGLARPLRTASPLPRADSPAYWQRGVGY